MACLATDACLAYQLPFSAELRQSEYLTQWRPESLV